MFEFQGVTDPIQQQEFTLAGLTGMPQAPGSNKYLVDGASYTSSTCLPVNTFSATILDGSSLHGTASNLYLSLPEGWVSNMPALVLHLTQVTVTGSNVGGAGQITGGVLTGAWSKADFDAQFQGWKATCAAGGANRPAWCSYLSVAASSTGMLFNLDLDHDGLKDSAAVCLSFATTPALIVGIKP